MIYPISHIAEIIQAKNAALHQAEIDQLLYDSRQLIRPDRSLFFALKGQRQDGHSYIPELYAAGVRNFVVETLPVIESFDDSNFLIVNDSLAALQQLAGYHRQQFQFPVIGITGSNGKTVVKEWLFQLLHPDFHIIRSPKSFNSQIGVPVSLWQMNTSHNLALIEAGISRIGEMEKLAKMIHPTLGLITTIGEAHDEGFSGMEQKMDEKLRLFEEVETLFFSADQKFVRERVILNFPKTKNICTWSATGAEADFQVHQIQKGTNQTTIKGTYQESSVSFTIPFADDASIENAIHCGLIYLYLGAEPNELAERMAVLEPIGMRLELKAGTQQCTIINDAYNSDLGSLRIALNFLQQQTQHDRATLILSDILQSGESPKALYARVAELLQIEQLDQLIGIGAEVPTIEPFLPKQIQAIFYPDTDTFLASFPFQQWTHRSILLKGARQFSFEKIADRLSNQVHQAQLEINLNALVHNLKAYYQRLQHPTKMLVMVKAAAYGSGAAEVARLLEYQKVDYLGVAYAHEGVALRKAGIQSPILVLNPDPGSFDNIIRFQLEPEIYSTEQLQKFLEVLPIMDSPFGIHIKVETGMHRLGFSESDLPELIRLLHSRADVKVLSVFTHLSSSEDLAEDAFSHDQANTFLQTYDQLADALPYRPMRHLLNSSGILRFPQYQLDMVRLGIGIYGIDSSQTIQELLQPVFTLKARVSQVREVAAGQSIGYNRKGQTNRPSRIATIGIGYADGLLRAAGNGNFSLLIQNQAAPLIGNVCMDMCMADVTDIPNVQAGDEAIIFGQTPTVQDLARSLNTIPYEVLTNLSDRLKRVYVQE